MTPHNLRQRLARLAPEIAHFRAWGVALNSEENLWQT